MAFALLGFGRQNPLKHEVRPCLMSFDYLSPPSSPAQKSGAACLGMLHKASAAPASVCTRCLQTPRGSTLDSPSTEDEEKLGTQMHDLCSTGSGEKLYEDPNDALPLPRNRAGALLADRIGLAKLRPSSREGSPLVAKTLTQGCGAGTGRLSDSSMHINASIRRKGGAPAARSAIDDFNAACLLPTLDTGRDAFHLPCPEKHWPHAAWISYRETLCAEKLEEPSAARLSVARSLMKERGQLWSQRNHGQHLSI